MNYLASDKYLEKFGEYIKVKKNDPSKGIDGWKGWIASEFLSGQPANIGFLTSADAQARICNNENIYILGGSNEVLLKLSNGTEQGVFKLSFGEYIKLEKATNYSIVADDNKLTFCYLMIPENAVIEKYERVGKMNLLEKKLLGCLVGAAAADALGAATELRTTEQIKERFGGLVEDFIAPPDDTFARGNKPGQVTDDFSCAYVTCQEIIKNKGEINEEITKQGLLEWAKVDEFFQRFAGPTTRAAVEALKGAAQPALVNGVVLVNDNSKASNGGAMKISPIALFSNGDVDKAIEIALTVCKWTHNNNIALSGAAAVAAATAKAMDETATLEDVIEAGLYGAEKGDKLGREKGKTLAGPSVYKRIKLAVKIGKESSDIITAMEEISDIIGTGLAAAEAVPAAFGLMSAAKGNTKDAILAAVNIGNDTDTIATMTGGILGTLNGIESLPGNYLAILDEANNFDLQKMANDIGRLM